MGEVQNCISACLFIIYYKICPLTGVEYNQMYCPYCSYLVLSTQ